MPSHCPAAVTEPTYVALCPSCLAMLDGSIGSGILAVTSTLSGQGPNHGAGRGLSGESVLPSTQSGCPTG